MKSNKLWAPIQIVRVWRTTYYFSIRRCIFRRFHFYVRALKLARTSFSSPIFFSSKGIKEELSNYQTPLYFLRVGGLNGCQTIIPSRLQNKVLLDFAKKIALLKYYHEKLEVCDYSENWT